MRLLELTLERDNAEGCEAPAEPHRAAALAKAMAAARAGGCGTGASSLGLDLSTPHSILYDLLSLGSLQEGFFFSFPPSPFWVYQQKISAAAKLGRWGTQHKEMAHPLTQPVRCCWSFPCEFAQPLWEGKFWI